MPVCWEDFLFQILITLALGWDPRLFAEIFLISWLPFPLFLPLIFLFKLKLPLWAWYVLALKWIFDSIHFIITIREVLE